MAETTEQQTAEQTTGDQKTAEAQNIELNEAVDSDTDNGDSNLDLLLDVTMDVTVTLGNAKIPVRRLLQVGPGSVLQMDKLVDEPAELYVQGNKFATGTIVIVDGHFAIKINEVLGM